MSDLPLGLHGTIHPGKTTTLAAIVRASVGLFHAQRAIVPKSLMTPTGDATTAIYHLTIAALRVDGIDQRIAFGNKPIGAAFDDMGGSACGLRIEPAAGRIIEIDIKSDADRAVDFNAAFIGYERHSYLWTEEQKAAYFAAAKLETHKERRALLEGYPPFGRYKIRNLDREVFVDSVFGPLSGDQNVYGAPCTLDVWGLEEGDIVKDRDADLWGRTWTSEEKLRHDAETRHYAASSDVQMKFPSYHSYRIRGLDTRVTVQSRYRGIPGGPLLVEGVPARDLVRIP